MKPIFFLVNCLSEFDFGQLLAKYLPNFKIVIGDLMPSHTEDFRLIVLWSYKKILKKLPKTKNVILFHSSDLPEGKGWAPIYYALAEDKKFYVISGIFAAQEVDAGDVIIKARFRIRPEYTASDLRRFDEEISIMMISEILNRFKEGEIFGVPQEGQSTFRRRRSPEDNALDLNKSLAGLIPALRASESRNPAFFFYRGRRFTIEIHSYEQASFPDDLEFLFPPFQVFTEG